MNPPELRLTPVATPLVGGTPATTRLVVRNTGPEVERYELVAVGPLETWTSLEEAELRIWPGEERETQVRVLLPVSSAPHAGPTEVGVMAIAGDGDWAEARTPAHVAPRPQVVPYAPSPHAVRTARRALVHLAVANTGNVPLSVVLVARDREGALAQDSPRPGARLDMAPGQAFTVPLVLRCTKPAWLGRSTPRDYTIESIADPARASVGGVLVQEPVLRRWWLVALALLWVVTLAADGGLQLLLVLALVVAVVLLVVTTLRRYSRVVRGRPGGR